MRIIFYSLGILLMTFSCTPANVIKGVHVKYEKPENILELDYDSSFTFDFHEATSCNGLSIINDTILLVHGHPGSDDSTSYFFKAYSLPSCSYKGEHIRKGRGPGEFLSPIWGGACSSKNSSNRCEYLFDISLEESFAYDFIKSMETGMEISYPISELPQGTLYAYSFQDSLQFIIHKDSGHLLASLADSNGDIINTINLYPDIETSRCYPLLSNSVAVNSRLGTVATLMCYLPQINFINPVTGEIRSFAVDNAYKNWKDIVNISNINSIMNASMYYSWANATQEHIMAIYMGMSPKDLRNKTKKIHLHVFNWEGDFLYDITLKENICSPVYDAARKHLYAVDYTDEHIYRYDLSGLI